MLLSDRILDANEEVLRQMLDHRFIADIKANRLPRAVFHNYLVHEGAFVNTAISIIAYALARAPDIGMQRWLIGILDALASVWVYHRLTTLPLTLSPSTGVCCHSLATAALSTS